MTVKELAVDLKKHPNTIRKWIAIGAIKAVRLGREWIIPEDEVEKIKKCGVTIPNTKL